MNLDAYNDQVANEWPDIGNAEAEWIPGYDPDHDPMYQIGDKPHYSADLHLASQNYWAGKTGRETPPPPSYRTINGRAVLGRFLDVYGCQAHMRAARHDWQTRLWKGIIAAGILVVAGVELGPLDVFAIPFVIALFVGMRIHYARIYNRYYTVQEQILRSGQPVWLPFERKRLRMIQRSSFYVWP